MGGWFSLGALALLSAAPAPWASSLSSMVKVRPGQALPRGEPAVRVSLAGGECEGAQLWVEPGTSGVTATVEAPALGRRRLSAQLFREAYVEVAVPSNAEGAPGPWPDPLVPQVDAWAGEERRAFPADSTAERPLVIYVRLCAGAAGLGGVYRGAVRLEAAGGKRLTVPIEARLWRFDLPATSSLPTAFGLSIDSVARGHGLSPDSGEARALLRRYADALLAHRLTPFGLGAAAPVARAEGAGVQIDFGDFDREWGPYFEGTARVPGARFTSAQLPEAPRAFTEAQRIAYYAAVRDHFRAKGWHARPFFYAKDEPAPKDYPLVLAQAARVKRAGGIPVLITSAFAPALRDAAGIQCPVLNCFFPRPGPQTCPNPMTAEKLRGALPKGAQIWWYQSCMSHGCGHLPHPSPALARAFTGWASYMIDQPAGRNRAMGPLAFLAGVDGELYWDTVFGFNGKDPWRDAYAFGGNGDGTLFYPGTPAKIGGRTDVPVESLRLEQIRDGLEDYEYLRLLSASGRGALARRSVEKLVRSGYDITVDPSVWAQTREEIATAIEGASEYRARRPVQETP